MVNKTTRHAATPGTIAGVSALLKVDAEVDAATVAEVIELLKGGPAEPPKPTMEARPLIKRAEVVRLTGLHPVSVDRYARAGYLERVHLGGSSRASGFTASSVEKFLAGHVEKGA